MNNNDMPNKKLYCIPMEERDTYLEKFTSIYKELELEEIGQIENSFDDEIFVLTKKGLLYKTELCKDKLELISDNILKLYFLNEHNLYKITKENIILPIEKSSEWNDTDIYLNYNNCKYKKIVMNKNNIVLTTFDGEVREIKDVQTDPKSCVYIDDITIIKNEDSIEIGFT